MKKSTNFAHVCVRFDLITWLNLLDVSDYFNEIIAINKQRNSKGRVSNEKLRILYEYLRHKVAWTKQSYIDPLKCNQVKVNDIVKGLLNKSIYYYENLDSGCQRELYFKFDPKIEKYEQTDHGQVYLTIQKDILLSKETYEKIKEICKEIDCPIAVYVRRQVRLFLTSIERKGLYQKIRNKRRKY